MSGPEIDAEMTCPVTGVEMTDPVIGVEMPDPVTGAVMTSPVTGPGIGVVKSDQAGETSQIQKNLDQRKKNHPLTRGRMICQSSCPRTRW